MTRRLMRAFIRTLERLHRTAVRMAVAIEVDPTARCPGCIGADRFAGEHGVPRLRQRPASIPVRISGNALVLACVAHAPLMRQYATIIDGDGRFHRARTARRGERRATRV